MTQNEQIAQLLAENAALKAKAAAKLKVQRTKVLDKDGKPTSSNGNAVSVYGLAKFPTTLYPEQWASLLSDAVVAEIRKACAEVIANPNAEPVAPVAVAPVAKASGF